MNSHRPAAHRHGFCDLRLLIIAAGLLVLGTAFGQTADDVTATDLTNAALQSRIEQLQDSSAYDEATQSAALEFYRRAPANPFQWRIGSVHWQIVGLC